jgi:hypothetical protein
MMLPAGLGLTGTRRGCAIAMEQVIVPASMPIAAISTLFLGNT